MTEQIEEFGRYGSRGWLSAMWRGLRKACPACGRGRLFAGYTKTTEKCANCGLRLDGHQADDAPPYVTIIIIGHIAIPLALAAKQFLDPPLWAQFAFWGPVILLSTIWFLPLAKGGLIGLQWANRMHGFGEEPANGAENP
ncbi:MAG: DUF983 domain-containing protein [Marinicaulis sp.]|nr:DUF983 domain-containing protein [Marinicaulis sp.]NNL89776.1 DUF983 domain-containing protein [Marinicaulis sp.]